MAIVNMEQLVDHLIALCGRQFNNDLAHIYFGDVGIFPPQAFKVPGQKEERPVLCVIPDGERPVQGRSASSEIVQLSVFIAVLVNMTPYFKRLPEEAFGERKLVQTATKIRAFLQQDQMFDLQGQVITSRVDGINWDWMQRNEDSIRAAAISYTVQVAVDRLEM